MKHLLYGTAYYEEYLPYERIDQDISLMKAAHINVVRIAESTWSTMEPQDGVFDFSHIDRVLTKMHEAGIHVIIGTPTYAIPTWMVKLHPEVMAVTKSGRAIYGARQIMDITHPVYLFYAERMIRRLLTHVEHHPAIIGFQLDNETKYYDTSASHVQQHFVNYLKDKFQHNLDAMNQEFGLDYWSNRINSWEDFPDIRGSINASLCAEFAKFQRQLVSNFLSWQAAIVNEYRSENQFITHNFDFEWRGYSYGVQPFVNHFHTSECLTVAGTDIYHPTQDLLTGTEIAFCGDVIRSLKHDNYFVMETQAQGFPAWLPYPGQLRLQAFSHLASGANALLYWHWHSIHNSAETYWKGLLSHDFNENATYQEAKTIGNDFKRLSSHLINLKKQNRVAILISNEALTGFNAFPISMDPNVAPYTYNDVVRSFYDSLYRMNVECDFVGADQTNFNGYSMVIVPTLYSASETLLCALNDFVLSGGHLLASFKTGFSNENLKVYSDAQPHGLTSCFGITYNQFTTPNQSTSLKHIYPVSEEESKISTFMELIVPSSATVLATYADEHWKHYAAITRNQFGNGFATYIGCVLNPSLLQEVLKEALEINGLFQQMQELRFPLITRKGMNDMGKCIQYFFNYSSNHASFVYKGNSGIELLSQTEVSNIDILQLNPWGIAIIES